MDPWKLVKNMTGWFAVVVVGLFLFSCTMVFYKFGEVATEKEKKIAANSSVAPVVSNSSGGQTINNSQSVGQAATPGVASPVAPQVAASPPPVAQVAPQATAPQYSLSQYVQVTKFSKAKITGDYSSGIRLNATFYNASAKDIVGLKGRITFYDVFGKELDYWPVKEVNATIKSMGHHTVSGTYSEMGFKDIIDMEDGRYKVVWTPEEIVFSDGTRLK